MDGKSNEKAVLFPKKNLFGSKFKIRECSNKGCKKESLSREEMEKLDKCVYQGHVVSDPDSKVSLNQCDEKGVKDISVVSEKVCISKGRIKKKIQSFPT